MIDAIIETAIGGVTAVVLGAMWLTARVVKLTPLPAPQTAPRASGDAERTFMALVSARRSSIPPLEPPPPDPPPPTREAVPHIDPRDALRRARDQRLEALQEEADDLTSKLKFHAYADGSTRRREDLARLDEIVARLSKECEEQFKDPEDDDDDSDQ